MYQVLLSMWGALFHLIIKATQWGRYRCYRHFVDEEPEAKSADMIHPEQVDGRANIQAKVQEAGTEVRL